MIDISGGPRQNIFWVSLVALLACLCYANTLSNGFVSDDRALILDHPYTKRIGDWPRIFTAGHYEGTGGYRPITTLSFAVNYLLGDAHPGGYHLVNIALHALNAVLVVFLVVRLTQRFALGITTGLFFAVHPIHTEAVAWISGRAELLATGFSLVSWLCYLRWRSAPGKSAGILLGGLFAFLLACLSKENALILPLLIGLGDLLLWWCHRMVPNGVKNGKRTAPWIAYLLYLATLAFCFGIRVALYQRPFLRQISQIYSVDNPLAHAAWAPRLLTALKIQGDYLWLLLWPQSLSGDYSYNSVPLIDHLSNASLILALAAIAFLLAAAVVCFFQRKSIWFGILFYALTIFPVSNLLVIIGTIKAERLLYLPSIGFCFASGCLSLSVYQRTKPSLRWIIQIVLVLMIVAGVTRSWAQNRSWRDELSMWRNAAGVSPENYKAQLHYGYECLTRGDNEQAIAAFTKARQIDDTSEDATINLGTALMQARQNEQAIALYREAIQKRPNRAAVRSNLGLALIANGETASGIDELKRACDLDPKSAVLRFNLGRAFSVNGDLDAAAGEYRRALDLDPSYAEAWNALGAVLMKQGRPNEARTALEKALQLKPGLREAIYNLSLLKSSPQAPKKRNSLDFLNYPRP